MMKRTPRIYSGLTWHVASLQQTNEKKRLNSTSPFVLAILLNADLSNHLPKMPELAKLVNTGLSKGFTVPHVAEKHACPACPVEYLPCEMRSLFLRGEVHSSGVGPEDRTGGWTEPMVWSIALVAKGIWRVSRHTHHT
jgi:hypothetical protein